MAARSEPGLIEDARTAYEWIMERGEQGLLDPSKVRELGVSRSWCFRSCGVCISGCCRYFALHLTVLSALGSSHCSG